MSRTRWTTPVVAGFALAGGLALTAAPAGAHTAPEETDEPVTTVHAIPVACTESRGLVGIGLTESISITAPASVPAGTTFPVTFQATILHSDPAALGVNGVTLGTTINATDPAAGAPTPLVQPSMAVSVGDNPQTPPFTGTVTAGPGGSTITYAFVSSALSLLGLSGTCVASSGADVTLATTTVTERHRHRGHHDRRHGHRDGHHYDEDAPPTD